MQGASLAWARRGEEAPAAVASVLGQEPEGLGAILGLALLPRIMAGRVVSSSKTSEK